MKINIVCSLLGLAALVSSCSEKDYYDPTFMQNQAREAFPVDYKTIDANHTWETVALVKADITFGAEAPDSLWVYAGNPFASVGDCALLGKYAVQAGLNQLSIDKPAVAKYLYLLTRDSQGRAAAVADSVTEDGRLVHDFTAPVSKRSLQTRAASRAPRVDYGWTPATVTASDASLFPADAPAGSVALPANYDYYTLVSQGGNYLVTSTTQSIDCNAGANFYVKGEVSLSKIYFGGAGKIVLLPGSTLTMNGLAVGFNTQWVICPGAKLNLGTGTLQLSNNCQTVYNAGTIECGTFNSSTRREFYNLGLVKVTGTTNITDLYLHNASSATFECNTLDLNNNTKFLNSGQLRVAGNCGVENSNTLLANAGAIEAGSFNTAGSGSFYNEDTGDVSISGQSLVNSNNCVWDNSGRFTTRTMTFNATSERWYNRCQLFVTELLTIELGGGYLYVDGGGYVECQNFYMNNAKVVMGSKAYFNCLGTATFNYSGYNPWWTQGNQGFFGVGEECAVIRIKRAVKNAEGTYPVVNFFDRLQVTTDGFEFPQEKDPWNTNYHMDGGASAVSYNGGTTDIEEGLCSPRFTPQPESSIPETPQVYTYAFEDMTVEAGDYDFNDVVFTVTNPVNGKVTLTLLAAGATKTNAVCLRTGAGNNNNIRTIIPDATNAFTGSDGYIINTELGEERLAPVVVEVDVPEGFSITEDGDFFIADAFGTVHLPRFTQGFQAGDVPYALRVPGLWAWPQEFWEVTDAYPNFVKWAQDATQETEWYKDYVDDKVIK